MQRLLLKTVGSLNSTSLTYFNIVEAIMQLTTSSAITVSIEG